MHTITLSATSSIRLGNSQCRWVTKIRPFWIITFFALMGLLSSSVQGQSLQITKSVDKTTINPNSRLQYTIQYNCVSITDPCQNVVITDLLQPGLTDPLLLTNTGTATYDPATRLVTFNLGNLPAGTTGQVNIYAAVPLRAPGGTVIPNSATIISGNGSPIVSNTVSTTVLNLTQIDLYKSVNASPDAGGGVIPQGSNGSYSLTFNNAGNTPLTNFCATDILPSPDKLRVTGISTGLFNAGAPPTVYVEYQTNVSTAWAPLTGSPFSTTVATVVPISLPGTDYVTAVRWCFDSPYQGVTNGNDPPRIYFKAPADMPLGTITNCLSASATEATRDPYCTDFKVTPAITGSLPGVQKRPDNPAPAVGDVLTFSIVFSNSSAAARAIQNGIIADMLPNAELAYVPNSWSYTSTYSATAPTFSSSAAGANTQLKWALTGDVPIGNSITVTFKATVKNTEAGVYKYNNAYVIGSNTAPNACVVGFSEPDQYDIDGDGNTTETVCKDYATYTIQSLAKLTSEKLVKGQLDPTYSKYPAFGNTVPGGLADYQLRVSNQGSIPMKDIVVIDVLPFIGDNGVLDPQARLSQWRPNLAGPVTPPAGVSVYYSTQSNPCRPELSYNPAGCTNANWATVPPADITQVQALKFDFGSIVINPGDSLFLTWPMRAPTTAPTNGEIAWNSFGYVGTRTDNNTQLLPGEPVKVGIKVNPLVPAVYGDFVWLDTNKDGIQDAGELGISGVKVELYKDNGDGVPDKTTDALVGFTVTDASGNYLFSSLQPGDYFAIFYPPSGYAVSPSLVGSDKTKDSEGIIAAVTSLSATEVDLTWDLGLYPSTTCDVKIANTTVSPCSYNGTSSQATVNVFVTWANAPAGQNITVSVAGAPNQTINVTGGATSPALLTFTIAADGATHAVTAGFDATCQNKGSVLAPQPCAPAVCAMGLTNVQTGACSGTKRQVNGTVSWSNNPVGENIIVLWDGVPVDTILVSGGLGSPQPTSFYAIGGAGTHTLTARFASSTACTASVSGISVAACVLPCGLNMSVTPSLCQSATNAYVLSGSITATNVPVSGTLTISSTAFAPRSLTLPAGNASGTFSYSGLVSNGQTYTVTASYSNSACSPVSQTYTAPASCSVAPVCSISATASAGVCNPATNAYSATVVVGLTNAPAGTITVSIPGSAPISQPLAANTTSFTAVFTGLPSNGGNPTVTVSLTGCSTTTTTYTAPVSCSVAPVCSLSASVTAGQCASATNTYSTTAVVTVQNPPAGGTVLVSTGGQTIPFSTTANTQNIFTAVFNGLVSDGQSHVVTSTLPGCGTVNTTYTAPVSCSVAPVCSLTATVTPGLCATATNTYSATAVVTVQNPASGGTVTVRNGTQTLTFSTTAASQNTFRANFNGLISDGASHTVTVSLPGCGTVNTTYTAPTSCSVAPVCSLTAMATAGLCTTATNTYSATVLVTVTNAPTGRTLTVTNGPASVMAAIPAGGGVVTFPAVFNGLVSDGATHTITASLLGCSTTTATYTAPGSCTQPTGTKLTIDKLVNKSKAQIGDVLTYTLVLANIGTATATNVAVRDSNTTGLRYVAGSATAPAGTTFTPGTPISTWTVGSISAGQSLSLTFQAIADSSGILYNKATIPGDTATVCTSIPVKVCAGDQYTFRLTAPIGRSSYRWFRNDVEIAGQTTNTLDVTQPGAYSLAVDNVSGRCPDFTCCPFIIEEDTLPSFQAIAITGTCMGNTPQANGRIVLTGFRAGYTYQYSLGATFNPVASLSGAARQIPVGGVIVSNLASPVVSQAYTVRVYNSSGCYTDMTVNLQPTVCSCPAEVCVPYVVQQTKRPKRIGDPR